MNIKIIFSLCLIMLSGNLYADNDCLNYKLRPVVNLQSPTWNKEVVQPLKKMDLLHGKVTATLIDNYEIVADVTNIEDGYCISLKGIDATVGYSNFLVQIDSSHIPDSCTYNAILAHEDEHIRAYLSVIDEFDAELKNSIFTAADSIMPVFVSDYADIENVIDELNMQFQSHPELILIKQKIKAAEEIKNKKIDMNETGAGLKKCKIISD